MDFSKRKKAGVATKHKKGKVIAPVFENHPGPICSTPWELETDSREPFSREVEKADNPVISLRINCLIAAEVTGLRSAIANEEWRSSFLLFFLSGIFAEYSQYCNLCNP